MYQIWGYICQDRNENEWNVDFIQNMKCFQIVSRPKLYLAKLINNK